MTIPSQVLWYLMLSWYWNCMWNLSLCSPALWCSISHFQCSLHLFVLLFESYRHWTKRLPFIDILVIGSNCTVWGLSSSHCSCSAFHGILALQYTMTLVIFVASHLVSGIRFGTKVSSVLQTIIWMHACECFFSVCVLLNVYCMSSCSTCFAYILNVPNSFTGQVFKQWVNESVGC